MSRPTGSRINSRPFWLERRGPIARPSCMNTPMPMSARWDLLDAGKYRRRAGDRRGAAGRPALDATGAGDGAGRGGVAGAPGPSDETPPGRGRKLPAGIRSLDARGPGADVPGRGAAAHARRGDPRPADRREDRLGRLGRAPRPVRQPVRQRLDLGADADRPAGRAGRRGAARPGRVPEAAGRPARRAGDPPRGRRRDAASWATSSCSAAPSRRR